MRTRHLTPVILLMCCGLAVAAHLPAPWILGAVTRETGWRFRQEFATWPGPYWRGPERPPVVAVPGSAATWGALRLGGPCVSPPAPQSATTEIIAPLVEDRPVLDGVLGWQEWAGAATAVEPLDYGETMVILAQHTADTLFVCLAAPSLLTVRRGQEASLCFAPADDLPMPLSPSMRQLRLRAGRPDRPELQSYRGERGEWRQERLDPESPGAWRGAVSAAGDSAWGFAVYEFAIPLGVNSPCPSPMLAPPPATGTVGAASSRDLTAPLRPEQWRFMARLQTLSRGEVVGGTRIPDAETVVWPDSRTSNQGGIGMAVGARPDYWQSLSLAPGSLAEGVEVPVATRPIRVDGQIGLKEWRDAYTAEYRLPGDQRRWIGLARDQQHLYVAVRLHMARGLRSQEHCRVYIDPSGDRGLLPRGDDVQYRLPLGPDTVTETLRYSQDRWQSCAHGEIAGASYPLSTYESTYELAVPLTALGPDLHPNIAVEVAYGLVK